jgi:hypothetical protein
MKLLSIGSDSKTVKGEKYGYLTGILYLAPSDVSGVMNTCPHASKGCRLACLYSAGRGAFSNVQKARIEKTRWFHKDRDGFMAQLHLDILALKKKAKKEGKIPCVRLNGTSDIPWEDVRLEFGTPNIMTLHKDVQFYDYTKNARRMRDSIPVAGVKSYFPTNYHLTFSRSENNQKDCLDILNKGGNVAMVFANMTQQIGFLAFNHEVIDGDLSDLRFLDPSGGVIVGLKAKGKAKKDLSGFVL